MLLRTLNFKDIFVCQSSLQLFEKPVSSPEVLGSIASMDNVFGYVTEHDMRFESTVRNYVPENKRFWICNGSMILLGTLIGCNGTTTAFSNIWPDALKELLNICLVGCEYPILILITKIHLN